MGVVDAGMQARTTARTACGRRPQPELVGCLAAAQPACARLAAHQCGGQGLGAGGGVRADGLGQSLRGRNAWQVGNKGKQAKGRPAELPKRHMAPLPRQHAHLGKGIGGGLRGGAAPGARLGGRLRYRLPAALRQQEAGSGGGSGGPREGAGRLADGGRRAATCDMLSGNPPERLPVPWPQPAPGPGLQAERCAARWTGSRFGDSWQLGHAGTAPARRFPRLSP